MPLEMLWFTNAHAKIRFDKRDYCNDLSKNWVIIHNKTSISE
jgi:hypothetical protein